MSYIVTGNDIPQNCNECNLRHSLFCRAYDNRVLSSKGMRGRDKFCPLIEIPPHGRLGDLDALVKTLEQNRLCYVLDIDDESFELGIDKAISIVKEAPTVIEAED